MESFRIRPETCNCKVVVNFKPTRRGRSVCHSTVFGNSPRVRCLFFPNLPFGYRFWRSPRILAVSLRQFHSFSAPGPMVASGEELGQGKDALVCCIWHFLSLVYSWLWSECGWSQDFGRLGDNREQESAAVQLQGGKMEGFPPIHLIPKTESNMYTLFYYVNLQQLSRRLLWFTL